ncbi:cyclic nucleotide-binding domain-containing protein [Chryseobacterium wangxinyae]|uniref:Crp/Fnr family transcriptional regulator n=1 Tax=Chryseobacterium sp. CY350 TaxID=2997336 RepID=UPI0022708C1E|nr:cyclic nucleotide-binding domain-containing protein [Chryseobacterium sp. CY350]MCY0976834.1 cyclic nucleotide-binding domain-containing protein [Chryseobacterium sp. CY350]WBZ96835.1 cyclic nucleotide-binding domain-containing protein [Chryseobacterium sp. CY350]
MNIKITTEWEKYSHLFERLEIPAYTKLLSEGQFSEQAFIIIKGALRSYTNDDAPDITYQFFFEDEFFFSVESFLNGRPSLLSVETIEPSTVYSISKNNFHQIITSSDILQKQIDEFTVQTMIHFHDIATYRIEHDPEKKYLKLQKDNPRILLRVPQYYIASFLGISVKELNQVQNKYDSEKKLN